MPIQYKVLVVDDSSFMRQFISDYLSKENSLKVIGTASNGLEALKKIKALKPDVVTLDVEMPVMDGLTALKEIMSQCPIPVVMLSSYTQDGAEATFKALELGAVDFISKPSGTISLNLDIVENEIIEKVKSAAQVSLKKFTPNFYAKPLVKKPKYTLGTHLDKVVAVGTSTGGPRALHTLLADLPQDLKAGVLIVQHMPPGFTNSLAARLNNICKLTVKEAQNGDELLPGLVLIAPGDYHIKLKSKNKRFFVELNQEPTVSGHRPSVDVMMKSVAETGLYTTGVLMTGMGKDGALGMEAIKENHGETIAEDASTCIVYGMPKEAIELNAANHIVPLPKISAKIVELVNNKRL